MCSMWGQTEDWIALATSFVWWAPHSLFIESIGFAQTICSDCNLKYNFMQSTLL